MIKNREDFNRKLRADSQENYRKDLNNYLKKELVDKENKFKDFILKEQNSILLSM